MGLPPGWAPRTSDDVKRRIESIAKTVFKAVDTESANIRNEVQEIQNDIVISLSPLGQLSGFEKEKTLLKSIEAFEWEKKASDYIHAFMPKQFISRDSAAVSQGIRIPAYLYFEVLATEYRTRCVAVEEFLAVC